MMEKVLVKVHPRINGLITLMDYLQNGELTIKIQNGIPMIIKETIRNIDPGDITEQNVPLKRIS